MRLYFFPFLRYNIFNKYSFTFLPERIAPQPACQNTPHVFFERRLCIIMNNTTKIIILFACVFIIIGVFFYYQSTLTLQKSDSIQVSAESTSVPKSDSASFSFDSDNSASDSAIVYVSKTGSKYHTVPDCGQMNPDNAKSMTVAQPEDAGLTPCSRCFSQS